ncbi:MAG TPA: folylpolyglutamate synthase/dihydrofolate synthase family protein [Polyangia bacterium]
MLGRLVGLRRFGVRPGLDGTRALLAAVGNPERGLEVVHVGGTNGKGSTAAMIAAGSRADGRRVGLYTSPHLLRFTERIVVDGAEIGRERAVELAERVLGAGEGATFFEVVTVMALLAFAEARVDVAVMEVGLGGRLDATNVVERPRCAVVTSIGLDHTDVLGPTIAEIAREKAGIWKPASAALFACADEGAAAVLQAEAERVGAAPIERFGRDFDDAELPTLALAGAHQRRNAALARRALERLGVGTRAIREGLANVKWPGRMERLSPTVMVDAAHNEEGARALAASWPEGNWTLVVGVVAGKDARAIVAPLAKKAARVIVTAPPTPRALAPEELARLAPGATVAQSLEAALAAAAGERVIVAGSIFLVGEARRLVLGEAADALVAQDPPATQKL